LRSASVSVLSSPRLNMLLWFVVRTYLLQVICLAIIFIDILCCRRAHSCLGWLQWSCGGSFGASTSRFSFVLFKIANASSGSHITFHRQFISARNRPTWQSVASGDRLNQPTFDAALVAACRAIQTYDPRAPDL